MMVGGQRRPRASRRVNPWSNAVTLRLAEDRDRRQLERLAQLDTRPLPPGPHLVAVREARVEAALSVSTGELVADPFRRTAELCELLRCHAGELRLEADPAPAARLTPRAHPVPA